MTGEIDLAAGLEALLAKAGGALHDVVAEEIFPISQDRCPKESGELAATGRVSDPQPDGTVILSYGNQGDKTGIYAIVQEMDVNLSHPNGGQARYVDSSVMEAAGTLAERVAARMK